MQVSQATRINLKSQIPMNNTETQTKVRNLIYKKGDDAKKILEAKRNEADYLLVLNSTWDNYLGCFIEERAWIKSAHPSGADEVVVEVGKSHTICTSKIPNSDEINEVAKSVSKCHRSILNWKKYQDFLKDYFESKTEMEWAKQQYTKSVFQIEKSRKEEAKYKNWLQQVAPK